MNESMLHSLMHLFAIIASIKRETVMVLARKFVESYLNQELSRKLADKYLAVFDFYYQEIEAPAVGRKGKKTSSLSVKILAICNDVNQELHIRNKFRILLSLLQFMKYFESYSPDEEDYSQTISDAVGTIAEGLMITREEFKNCSSFVNDKFYKVPDRGSLLVISGVRSFQFTEIRHLYKDNLKGQILILQIKRADTYLFHYTGKDRLELNGKYVFPRYVYYLPKGSSIRSASITPVYYSDITSSYHQPLAARKISLIASGLEYHFPGSANGIQKFNFYGESGQLIGIMGGSGTGKTTLVRLLNGTLRPVSGSIRINGKNLGQAADLKGLIGNIPQEDLLMEELTVFQNLYYNARLCLSGRAEDEIIQAVNRLLDELGLLEIRDLRVGSPLNKLISGGQRKRLNIALELIRSPYVLFVDEPTSGLSSTDSENVMYLLKEQAVKGKLIVVIIHQPSSELFKMFDRLLILDRGGYPIYQGDPVEALRYFKEAVERVDSAENDCPACGNVNTGEILQIVEARDIDENGEYTAGRKRSPVDWYRLYLNSIDQEIQSSPAGEEIPRIDFRIPGLFKQFGIFSTRNLLAKIADRQYLLIALLVVPLLALILGYFTKYVSGDGSDPHRYLFSKNENLPAYLFMSVIVALFLGMIISAEEIIKDSRILTRESFLNLSRTSYLLSKVVFLFILSAYQTLAFVLIGNCMLQVKGLTLSYWLILFSTSCFANLVGLNISDGLKSVVAIYIVVPFLLVPQILLAGVIVKFDKLHYSVASHQHVPVVGDMMVSRWAYEAMAVNQFRNNRYHRELFDIKQLESNVAYNLQHLIPLVREKLYDLDALLEQAAEAGTEGDTLAGATVAGLPAAWEAAAGEFPAGKAPGGGYPGEGSHGNTPGKPAAQEQAARIINLVRNSLEPFHRQLSLACFEELTPGTYDSRIKRELVAYLDVLQDRLSGMLNDVRGREKQVVDELMKHHGGVEGLAALKRDYHNESLADLVLNRNELRKVYEAGERFIRKMEPVYRMPESRDGRAHFYSAYKQVGGLLISTLVFNVTAIWVMTLILYIALQYRWLARIIDLSGRLSTGGTREVINDKIM